MTDAAVFFVFRCECEARADGHLGADDAVTAVEVSFAAEHVHGAALALGIAALASRKLRHDAFRVHAAGQHMAMIAVAGDNRIVLAGRGLHADDNGLLADVEMAEPADQAHSIQLTRLFFETADQKHILIIREQFVVGGDGRGLFGGWLFAGRAFRSGFGFGCHYVPRLVDVDDIVRPASVIDDFR